MGFKTQELWYIYNYIMSFSLEDGPRFFTTNFLGTIGNCWSTTPWKFQGAHQLRQAHVWNYEIRDLGIAKEVDWWEVSEVSCIILWMGQRNPAPPIWDGWNPKSWDVYHLSTGDFAGPSIHNSIGGMFRPRRRSRSPCLPGIQIDFRSDGITGKVLKYGWSCDINPY